MTDVTGITVRGECSAVPLGRDINNALNNIATDMTTMPPTADMNQETGAVGGQGGAGGGGGAPPPPVLGPRKPSEQFTVDDFLYEMESRPQNRGSLGNATPMGAAAAESGVFSEENSDMYAQLEQKERDLVLAAELGKVLLDKNEELSRQNERIAEDFSLKLEVRFPIYFEISIAVTGITFLSKQLIQITCEHEVPNDMYEYVQRESRSISPTPLYLSIRHSVKKELSDAADAHFVYVPLPSSPSLDREIDK